MTWKKFNIVDFDDSTNMQFHVDTRDFYVVTSKEAKTDLFLHKIKKYPGRFFFTADEVRAILTRLWSESGGNVKWRHLSFQGEGYWNSRGWRLKYIRIYRTPLGLVMCNNENFIMKRALWESPIDQRYLNAH